MTREPGVTFHLFGPVRAEVAGRVVDVRDHDLQVLLAVLLLRRNQEVPVGDLRHALWGTSPPHRADAEVRRLVGELAGDLARAGVPRLQEVPAGWVLRADDAEVDLARFEQLQNRAAVCVAEGQHLQALPLQRQAVELAAPGILVGLRGSLVAGHRKLVGRRVRAVTLAYADSSLALGRGAEVVGWFEALTAAFPDETDYWERLVAALLQSGHVDEAARAVDRAEVQARPGGADRVRALRARTDAALGTRATDRRARAAADPVYLSVLAQVAVTRDGRTVPLDDRATRALLCALLLCQGHALDEAELTRVLDDGDGDPPARGLVRDRLVAVDALVGPGLRVARTDAGWRLDVRPPHRLDLLEARELERTGRALLAQGDRVGAKRVRRAVLAAVPERPLPGLRGTWFDTERARLVVWRAAVAADLAAAAANPAAGDDRTAGGGEGDAPAATPPAAPSVVDDLAARVAAEPLREDLWEAYLGALHDAGRTVEALAEYDRMAHLLRQWLGTPPGPALQMLRRRLGG